MKLPENKFGTYNIIQLYIDMEPYLLLGSEPHGILLAKLLDNRRIPYGLHNGTDYPKPTELRYQTIGMGNVFLDNVNKLAVFEGGGWQSGYHIRINEDFIEKIKQHNPDWEIVIK